MAKSQSKVVHTCASHLGAVLHILHALSGRNSVLSRQRHPVHEAYIHTADAALRRALEYCHPRSRNRPMRTHRNHLLPRHGQIRLNLGLEDAEAPFDRIAHW